MIGIFEVIVGMVIAGGILAAVNSARTPSRDSTDGPGKKSGLSVFTDQATGVQYVGTMMGGLTLRVDADGTPRIERRP